MNGAELKDEGQRAVLAAEDKTWVETVMYALKNWTEANRRFYLSDFRDWFEKAGGRPPHHPNVWGGITRALKGRGFRMTGGHRPSPRPSNRARLEFEWERT